jgi:lipopolysaccharide export system protein LptA
MRRNLNFIIVLLVWQSTAFALSTDREQPIKIEADTATIDDGKGFGVYQGNVVITQGTILINADKVTFHYNQKQQLEKVFANGNPARFKQRPDNSTEDLHAKAQQMEYFALKDMLNLLQDAELWQGKDIFTGPRISYDTKQSVIKADKGEKKEGQRITVTLQPRTNKPQPATPTPKP